MEDSKAMQVFQFKKEIPVRTQMINGNPWFVVADVCRVLEISNVSQVIDRLDVDGVCQTDVIDSLGRRQNTTVANEPNLYRLIFRSDKPEAKAFQDWVYNEVLPSIRKTGQYGARKQQSRICTPERRLLPSAEKDQYIFHVVECMGLANGRDVQRYCKWYSGKEARRRMADLAEQGELVKHPMGKTIRYSLPRKRIA